MRARYEPDQSKGEIVAAVVVLRAGAVADTASILAFCRGAIALRGREPELCAGAYETVDAGPGVWAWRRGREFAVAVNLSRRKRRVPLAGEIVLATRREREGESGPVSLGPAEGAVVHLERPLGHPGD